uniref:UDP-glycosyltransferase n=1 Tax=Heliothis virescens TaxID=7102 RepID=A0A2A4IU38_HELVI
MHLFGIIIAIFAIQNVQSANILGIFPHVGKSHFLAFEPLLKDLARRGHQVTVVSFFPQNDPPANYTDVSLRKIAEVRKEAVNLQVFEKSNKLMNSLGLKMFLTQIFAFRPLSDLALNVCSGLVKFPPLAQVLQKHYDVVLVENFNSDCVLGLLHIYKIKAPVISLLSCPMMQWSASRIGLTDNPSFVPTITSQTSLISSFLERLENSAMYVYFKLWFRYAVQVKERAIIEKRFQRRIPDLDVLAKNISMMLVNTHHSLNGVRPLLPGVVEVGGMHLKNKISESIPHAEAQEWAAGGVESELQRYEVLTDEEIVQAAMCEEDKQDKDSSVEVLVSKKVSNSEAVGALNTALKWAEDNEFDSHEIMFLGRLRDRTFEMKCENYKQKNITDFFEKN